MRVNVSAQWPSEFQPHFVSSAFPVGTGAFLGPTLGGLLLELVGARTAYSSTGILEVALAIVLFFVAMTPAFRQANTARSPLLGSA